MIKARLLAGLVAGVMLLSIACSKPKAPGAWSLMDPGVGDAFTLANFVDDSNGWINGFTDRDYTPPDEAGASNSTIAPKKVEARPGKKPDDPLKANQGFEVLRTTDGGTTWTQIPNQFKYKIRSVWFVNTQQGWSLTIDRDILHTADGGLTWTLQRKAGKIKLKLFGNLRQPEMEQPEQIDRIHFVDELHGWAWGGGRKDRFTEQPGTFLTTVDGGQNWNNINYPFTQNVWSMFFLNSRIAWVSDADGGFYKTTDGGLNWVPSPGKLPETKFDSIFFLDENNGWVAGHSGRLAKTVDGGQTWAKVYDIRNEFKMRDIAFTDQKHGWAVGDGGAILYTADGGSTWLDYSAAGVADLKDVVLRGNRGWAVGLSGAVLRYDLKKISDEPVGI